MGRHGRVSSESPGLAWVVPLSSGTTRAAQALSQRSMESAWLVASPRAGDPANPDAMPASLTADGLHPNDLGSERMTQAIDLRLLQ